MKSCILFFILTFFIAWLEKDIKYKCEIVTSIDVGCNGVEYRLKNMEEFNPNETPPNIGSKISCENIRNKEVDCEGKVYALSNRISDERTPRGPATNPVSKPKTKPSAGSEQ